MEGTSSGGGGGVKQVRPHHHHSKDKEKEEDQKDGSGGSSGSGHSKQTKKRSTTKDKTQQLPSQQQGGGAVRTTTNLDKDRTATEEEGSKSSSNKKKGKSKEKKTHREKGGGGKSTTTTPPTSTITSSTSTTASSTTGRGKREQLVNELLQSERAHVRNLNTFLKDYVIPLRDKKIIPSEDLQDILCNLELIRNWNEQFLEEMEGLLEDDCEFGKLFMEMIPMLRQLYAQYNENYAHAMEAYEKCKKNKEFATFLETVARKRSEEERPTNSTSPPTYCNNFLNFLYLPIQRMIAYDFLLKDLTAETPPDHPDHDNLNAALKLLREAADHADKLANQRKNIDKVISIQSQLLGEFTSLARPHRRFVYEGDVILVVGRTHRERHMFLFNDVLLCVHLKKKARGYKIDFLEPLETLQVGLANDSLADFRHAFRLNSPAKEYTLLSVDKSYWMQLISDSIKRHLAKASGVPELTAGNRPSSSSGATNSTDQGRENDETSSSSSNHHHHHTTSFTKGKSSSTASSSSSSSSSAMIKEDEEINFPELLRHIVQWAHMEDEALAMEQLRRLASRLQDKYPACT
ncbi:FYVEtype Zn finger-containing protein [Balamuthia mandrillaris]